MAINRKVYKYPIFPTASIQQLPADAKLLSVGVQEEGQIFFWAEVPAGDIGSMPTKTLIFHSIGTGFAEIDEDWTFFGTVHLMGGALVLHVYYEEMV